MQYGLLKTVSLFAGTIRSLHATDPWRRDVAARTIPAIDNELARLHALERAYDPDTIPLLEQLHLRPDARCLEVAGGAGSIARWMRRNTRGNVAALDIDVAHLRDMPGIEVIETDIQNWEAPRQFDLAHCRFLLDLLSSPAETVFRLAEAASPGGYLVLEEFDDLTASLALGPEEHVARHEQVLAAKQASFAAAGHKNDVGRRLPAMVKATHAFRVEASGHVKVRQGGDPGTESSRRYVENHRAALLATGSVDEPCLDAYVDQLQNPAYVYFAPIVVSVVAKYPPSWAAGAFPFARAATEQPR